MSTPTSEAINSNTSSSLPISELTQTTDEQAVSQMGKPISPPAPSSNDIRSGMNVTSQVSPTIFKEVNSRVIEGSHKGGKNVSGDIVKTSMDQIANPPNPRERVRQAPLSGRTPAAPAPVATDSASEVGD